MDYPIYITRYYCRVDSRYTDEESVWAYAQDKSIYLSCGRDGTYTFIIDSDNPYLDFFMLKYSADFISIREEVWVV